MLGPILSKIMFWMDTELSNTELAYDFLCNRWQIQFNSRKWNEKACKKGTLFGIFDCVPSLSEKAKNEVALTRTLKQQLGPLEASNSAKINKLLNEAKAFQGSAWCDAREILDLKEELKAAKKELHLESDEKKVTVERGRRSRSCF